MVHRVSSRVANFHVSCLPAWAVECQPLRPRRRSPYLLSIPLRGSPSLSLPILSSTFNSLLQPSLPSYILPAQPVHRALPSLSINALLASRPPNSRPPFDFRLAIPDDLGIPFEGSPAMAPSRTTTLAPFALSVAHPCPSCHTSISSHDAG